MAFFVHLAYGRALQTLWTFEVPDEETPVVLVVVLALPACAVQDGQVLYVGVTVSTLKQGSLGKLETTSPTALTFVAAGTKAQIPYAQIDSYEYTEPVAHHLGVLPAIGAGLVKARRHKHLFRVTYHEDDARPQVAIFEVSKQAARPLLAILQARAPQGCKTPPSKRCMDWNSL